MKSNKFNTLFEAAMSRYLRAGFLVGDVVTFVKGYKSHEDYKGLNDQIKAHLEDMVASGLNIRIVNITNAIPSRMNPDPAASTGEVYVDIALDEGGGRFSHQVVIPSGFLEVTELDGNLPPIPDAWKYKAKVNIEPEELVEDEEHISRQTDKGDGKLSKSDLSLPSKNTSIPSKAATSSPAAGGMHDYLKELKKA